MAPAELLKVFVAYTVLVIATCNYELTILHTNDVHARFEQFDRYGVSCSAEDAAQGYCYGGVARRYTMAEEIRGSRENVLLLDAGDQFQGTLWFYHYQGSATSHFMNALKYDAMALGNHEFDLEIEGLIPFLQNVTFPVLSCNIDDSKEPLIQGRYWPSITVTIGGEEIGIVGYIYSKTNTISPTGDLIFLPEVDSIQEEVDFLLANGVTKIIALGHSGIDIDLEIARKVRGVDVVVGGHSDTFLYNGEVPPGEITPVYDSYPIVINPDYDPALNILVVQDGSFGKYLGDLQVTFDDAGNVNGWSGNPILLDNTVKEDPGILAEVEEMGKVVQESFNEIVGQTHVLLQGDIYSCREEECNLGNLVCDAMLWEHIKYQDESSWSDVSIAIMPSGSIRSSISQGEISVGDVSTVLPFGNTNDIFELEGRYLIEVLEHSVARYNPAIHPGEFLQYSGISVTYNLNNDPGNRVVSAQVICTNCSIPKYEPLELDRMYKIVTTSYVAGGGDGYTVIDEHKQNYVTGNLDTSTMSDYIETHSPIYIGLQDRIKFVETNDYCSSSGRLPVSFLMLLCLSFISVVLRSL
ncbi:5'-nucleotidase [Holothuria leucospilota]|uniref:5'-nucleotidase n=1 Tax=Holothuria leucospilota TaxID=206669 RepID=A0A9Q0YPA7_HOLLE|nr:5'-nucleotidase [Holothuria leucospilota]